MILVVRAGDILLVRGRGWLSRGILRATGEKTPDGVSHAGMVLSGGTAPVVIEALTRVRTRPLSESLADVDAAWILRDKSLTPEQVRILVEAACQFSAESYGYIEICLQLLDALTGKTWWTDHLSWTLKKQPICSFIVAYAYAKLGLNFGKPDQSITPGDIRRFADGHVHIFEKWRIK